MGEIGQWEFVCRWYQEGEIYKFLNGVMCEVPKDIQSKEFSEWLTDQCRLAMNKGIDIGRNWEQYENEIP